METITTSIIATSKNVNHNKTDIWVEIGEFNYILPGFYYSFICSTMSLEDFANEIIFTVKSWGEEDNGCCVAEF